MNVRLKNVGDGNLRLARQVDVNLDVRPRIKHCGDAFVIITEQIGKFRDAFGLNGFKNERHDRTLRRSEGEVQQDRHRNSGEHRLPSLSSSAACRRHRGGKTSAHEMPEELFGNLLKRTGWQPMLAKAEVSAFPPRSAED